jgi:hypothetical protein
MTPQHEATQIFTDILQDLTSSGFDMKLVLRRCQHACQLLSWNDQRDWFKLELAGYSAGTKIPPYRRVNGILGWRVKCSLPLAEVIQRVTDYRAPNPPSPDEEVTLDLCFGIDDLKAACQWGFKETTGEIQEEASPRRDRLIEWERVRLFYADVFPAVLASIERMTFDFASQTYSLLRYGNVLTDLWTEYRTKVDAALRRLNLANHLDAIQIGLQSNNPEAWRNTAFGCRNLLNDVAGYLWRDTRKTYTHLPGTGSGEKLAVTSDKFANRLAAYIHQKGLRGTTREFVQNEMERLNASVNSLIALQSKAHAPITREDAVTAALGTYFILGELVIRTDMMPVEYYA